jgi:WD40 repeat protein
MSAAFSPDGKLLASVGGCSVHLWDVAAGTEKANFQLGPLGGVLWQVAFSPDGRHLATANCNGTVYILRLDPPPGKERAP